MKHASFCISNTIYTYTRYVSEISGFYGPACNVCKQFSLRASKAIPVVDMNITLCLNSNPIINMFTTELHVCKQQHTHGELKGLSMCLKYLSRYTHLGFDGLACTHLFKCLQTMYILHVNTNKLLTIH